MTMPRRRFLQLSGAAFAAGGAPPVRRAFAQTFPSRPVRFVVPFTPGGAADPAARVVGRRLSEIWGQEVVIENKPGGGGNIAATSVIQAAPDGHTLFLGGDYLSTIPFLYPKLGVNPLVDLVPLVKMCGYANLMVVPNTSPARTVREFLDLARANPGKLSYASAGAGSSPHLTGELFKRRAGLDIVHVPYRGGAPALSDLIPGRVDVMFATLPSVIGQARDGAVRSLAITSRQRVPVLPDVPTVMESGVTDFEASSFYAPFVSARTPPAIVATLREAFTLALADARVKQTLFDIGEPVDVRDAAEVIAELARGAEKWEPIIRAAGINGE